jgi:WD40 repeat protein
MAPRAALIALAFGFACLGRALEPPRENGEWPKLQHTLNGWSHGLAFSPDGKTLAVGEAAQTADRDIVLWDAVTGKRVSALTGQKDGWAVAFSPDGKTLASSGQGINLWDVATNKITASTKGHRGRVQTLAFSPDGKRLVSGASFSMATPTIGLWQADTLKSLTTAPEDTNTVRTATFSLDGKTLAFAGGPIRLWDVDTGRERAAIDPGGRPWVQGIAFSPDGKTLAVALQYRGPKSPAPNSSLISARDDPRIDHRNVLLWDVATGKLVDQLVGHDQMLTFVAFSPDGKLLASASADRTVRIWDVATKKTLATLEVKSPGQPAVKPWVDQVAFSPDGKVLATASRSGNVINLWSLERGK